MVTGTAPQHVTFPTHSTAGREPGVEVNDVHSQLNRTTVRRIARVESVRALQRVVAEAAGAGLAISIAGGRHAMGGQQFRTGALLVDTTALCRPIDLDSERGLITVEAGIDWPTLVTHLLWAGAGSDEAWGIIQKQTGADRLTIGGALSANIHGRGLRLRPIIADVESFELVDATGALVTCSRSVNRELFMLAIGGYGLFGVIARVTLRLARRHRLERKVCLACVESLPALFEDRIRTGFEYGDFQFAIDRDSPEFMHTGVFSCYRPIDREAPMPGHQRALSAADWQRLLRLAHTDKTRAFAEYARFYLSTDGQQYWSDTHQLAAYEDGYHAALDREIRSPIPGSEMISELYVPRTALPGFMAAARERGRADRLNIVYGTVRLIERDEESLLAWATEPWACVVFNLHVDHSPDGLRKAEHDFRGLIDIASAFGGSYYLTYHRWATREQVDRCHPRMRDFLERKRQHDPHAVFASDWHDHHARLMGEAPGRAR
jgi:FAD/FMN-containing dehydrogenase